MIPRQIVLTGKVYIKYITEIINPKIGDIKLLLNDDAISVTKGDYDNLKVSGYIKAKVFDGLIWQNINISDLCLNKEYKFTKRQKALDSAILCKNLLENQRGIILYKTYRGHFSCQER
ncbi:hypothetical protein [Candidatus Tisiphia endosymbiont of Beris chalybata]|uniref:hypothetical protein n=1 Tax=Candidatus Tisiphia endosymbiont of Beris chalybata TaxID=3066262 RepID=UPI00312CC0DA